MPLLKRLPGQQLYRGRGSADSLTAARSRLEGTLQEVMEKYGDVQDCRGTLKDSAAAMLYEVQNLSVGLIAPNIVGEDLEENELKLSGFRGKVVLLVFWGTWCGPRVSAVPEHVALLKPVNTSGMSSRQILCPLKTSNSTSVPSICC
jgi:hypothetical protein